MSETVNRTDVEMAELRRRARAAAKDHGGEVRHPLTTAGAVVAVAGLFVAFATVALAADRWLLSALLWLPMAFLLLTPVALVHEATHGWLAARSWLNHLIGMVCSGLIVTPWAAYATAHLRHHADTCGDGDPEGDPFPFTRRAQLLLVPIGGLTYPLELWWMALRAATGHPPAWVRAPAQVRLVRVNLVFMLVPVTAVVVAVVRFGWASVVTVWLGPVLVLLAVVLPLVFVPEHFGGRAGVGALANSRTTRSNAVLAFVYRRNNLHTAHHFLPSTNPAGLVAVQREIEPYIAPGWLVSSYTAFYRRLWHDLGR